MKKTDEQLQQRVSEIRRFVDGDREKPMQVIRHDVCPVCRRHQPETFFYWGESYCCYPDCGQKLRWE